MNYVNYHQINLQHFHVFFTYTKMHKNLSDENYQENK